MFKYFLLFALFLLACNLLSKIPELQSVEGYLKYWKVEIGLNLFSQDQKKK